MSGLPNASRATATYAFQVLAFRAPMSICEPAFELDRQDYAQRLSIVCLVGRLETFLFHAFQTDTIRRCGIYGDIIYIGTTPNIPGTQNPARPADALQAAWQLLTSFTGQQLSQPDWDSMREINLPRGRGLDLGSAGVQMARMMDLICSVPAV